MEKTIRIDEDNILVLRTRQVAMHQTVTAALHQRDALDHNKTHTVILTAKQMDAIVAAWTN